MRVLARVAAVGAILLQAAPMARQGTPEPQTIRFRIIVVSSADAAESMLDRLNRGVSFESLARAESIDPSAGQGGLVGPVALSDLRPELRNVLQALAPGANDAGYHLLNTNVGRDYTPHNVADITSAPDGDPCPRCGTPLNSSRGVEIANIYKLGTRSTEALGATIEDKDNERKPVIMGSYGIGVGRLLGCVAEAYNDADGLMWPISIAPYQVHLVQIGIDSEVAALIDYLTV